jgi:hypothetical protein
LLLQHEDYSGPDLRSEPPLAVWGRRKSGWKGKMEQTIEKSMEKEHGREDLTPMRRPCPRALP